MNVPFTFCNKQPKHLREFSEVKNKDGTGKITEWFPQNRQTELLNKYDQFTKRDFIAEKTSSQFAPAQASKKN